MFDNAYWRAMYRYVLCGTLREYLDLERLDEPSAIISLVSSISPYWKEQIIMIDNGNIRLDVTRNVSIDYWRVRKLWGSLQ